jgi:hypothetical protein
MTVVDALNILARRDEYEQEFGLTNPDFTDLGDGRVGLRFNGSGAGMFETRRELDKYCTALRIQKMQAADLAHTS